MKKKGVVSLKHIAELVGVSRMTVSMALRDDGRISEATRRRVHAAARKLGYAPNPKIAERMAETARAGHGDTGETLAYLTSEPTRDGWKRFKDGYFENIERRAAEYGYRIEPWWIADPALTPARNNHIIWSRGVRGVIIPNISHQVFLRIGEAPCRSSGSGFALWISAGAYGILWSVRFTMTTSPACLWRWTIWRRWGTAMRIRGIRRMRIPSGKTTSRSAMRGSRRSSESCRVSRWAGIGRRGVLKMAVGLPWPITKPCCNGRGMN